MTTCNLLCLFTTVGLFVAGLTLSAQPADIKFDRFTRWPNSPAAGIRGACQDDAGFLWLQTPSGSFRFDGNEFRSFPLQETACRSNYLPPAYTDCEGNRWRGDSLLRCTEPAGKVSSYGLPPGAGQCRSLFAHQPVTGDLVLWVLADSALLCFDLHQRVFTRVYRPDVQDGQSLYGMPFRGAFFSREGILWIGGEGGFCKYDWRNQEFRVYDLNAVPRDEEGDANFTLNAAEDPSKCWVTTNNLGLVQYDLHKRRLLPEKLTGELKRLSGRFTYGLGYDKLGRLWVGNVSDTIFVCDLQQNRIVRRIPLHGQEIHFANTDFARGRFWYLLRQPGGKTGMVRILPETMRMDTFWIPYWQDDPENNGIISWMPDKTGTLWFFRGKKWVECFNPAPYRLEQKPVSAFKGIEVDLTDLQRIRHDPDRKIIWLFSVNALIRLDWETTTARTYYNFQMKASEGFVRIEVDDSGKVWAQCNPRNVLYKFDPERETFARYDWSDGLPEKAVPTIWIDQAGKNWRQHYADHTFSFFDPLKITVIPPNPPLITGIHAGQKDYQPGRIIKIPASLATGKTSMRIDFTSIAFEQGTQLRFRYRMSGVDTAWVEAADERRAFYGDLSAGSYRFEVMVANREGDWGPAPATANFVILPPVYARTWFHVACSLLFLILFYAGLLQWDKGRKEQLHLRRRMAEDLHQEIGFALETIGRMSGDPSLKKEKQDFLDRIGRHTESATEKLGDLVWLINPENDACSVFVERISEYARSRLQPLGIVPEFRIEKKALRCRIPVEKRRELYFEFKSRMNELLEGERKREMVIRFFRTNGKLRVSVEWG